MKAYIYDRMMDALERQKLSGIRSFLISNARGTILEIGAGTGVNFRYYSGQKVTALEPDEAMRREAEKKVVDRDIRIIDASAEAIPLPDSSFDTVIVTLALCTIPDPEKSLREIRRVCKPGGKLLILEHIRNEKRVLAWLQDLLTPLWKRFAMGCHLNRDTLSLIAATGFRKSQLNFFFGRNFIYGIYTNVK